VAFTWLPWMHAVFGSRPVPLLENLVVVATGVVLLALLELEKWLLRRFDVFAEVRTVAGTGATPQGAPAWTHPLPGPPRRATCCRRPTRRRAAPAPPIARSRARPAARPPRPRR